MGTDNLAVQLLLLVFLIALNAVFAASELAVISLGDGQLRRDADDGDKKAKRLLKLTSNPSRFLAAIQVGVTLSGFLASAVAATSFAERVTAALSGKTMIPDAVISAVSTIVITLILSYFTLVFGELVPKRVAMQKSKKVAYAFSGFLSAVAACTRPFIWILSKSTNGVLRLFGIDPNAQDDAVTEEEIRLMVEEGEERGVIEESAREMIDNIFEFDDITAGEVMTHRTDLDAVEDTASVDEVVALAMEEGRSRIPVFHEDLDDIVGILYIKDLLKYVGKPVPGGCPLTGLMRKTLFVPESKKCRELFAQMQQSKLQMAVVVDEYGGTAGIVTMEDLLESIVGNIQDEYDDEEEEMVQLDDKTYTIDGTTDLDEVADLLDIDLPEEEYDTLGGMLTGMLGRIPETGDGASVILHGYRFTVQSVDDRRIGKVLCERLPDEESGKDQ